MKKTSIYLLLILFVSSCYVHLEKRHFNKGYHLEIGRNHKNPQNSTAEILAQNKSVKDYRLHHEHIAVDSLKSNTSVLANSTTSSLQPKKSVNSHMPSNSVKKQKANHVFQNSSSLLSHSSTGSSNAIKNTKQNTVKSSDALLLSTAFLSVFLLLFGVATRFKNSLSRVSRWASQNKYKALSIVVLAQLALAKMAMSCGEMLHHIGYSTSVVVEYFFSGVIAAVFLSRFIFKQKFNITKSFVREKLKYGASLLAFVMLMVGVGNRLASGEKQTSLYGKMAEWRQKKQAQTEAAKVYTTTSKAEQKVNPVSQSNQPREGLIALYVLLIVLIALAVPFLVCVAACSDSAIGVVAVMVIGLGLVILLSVAIHKEKNRGRR